MQSKILIHGDDIVSSRKRLVYEKEQRQDEEIVSLNGTKITLPDIVLAVGTPSLLQVKRLIVVENFLLGALSHQKKQILAYLEKNASGNTLIFWEDREIDKAIVKKNFTNIKEFLFQPRPMLFRFLDSLGYSSPSELLTNFHQLIASEDPAFIYTMILRQWRYLIIACDLGPKGLSGLPNWQAEKFIRQARFFTLDELISLYRKLLLIDYQFKNGQTPLTYVQLLDIFLTTL